jgi:integral membrane sensor domain MASE1
MPRHRPRTILAHVALVLGSAGVLATGAVHLDEYAANGFSTVPTIGTLFLMNFIAASLVGVGLLLPLRRIAPHLADPLRILLALSGIGLAATSLIALWISESSSLFGFTDHGFRPTIIAAILAEATAIVGLTAYLVLAGTTTPRRTRTRREALPWPPVR